MFTIFLNLSHVNLFFSDAVFSKFICFFFTNYHLWVVRNIWFFVSFHLFVLITFFCTNFYDIFSSWNLFRFVSISFFEWFLVFAVFASPLMKLIVDGDGSCNAANTVTIIVLAPIVRKYKTDISAISSCRGSNWVTRAYQKQAIAYDN